MMMRLQKQFWDPAKLVCRARGKYGEPFNAERGVTQGGPLSSLMLNVCVNAMFVRRVMKPLHKMELVTK